MAVVVYLVLAVVFLILVYACNGILEILRMRRKVLRLGLPIITGLPILGNSLQLMKSVPGIPCTVFTLQTISGLRKALQEHDMFLMSSGPYLYVVLTKPEHVEILLSDKKQVQKSLDYIFFHEWFGEGLLTSPYQRWKKLRKIFNPVFNSKVLDKFQQIFSDHSDVLVQKLRSEVGKPYTHLGSFFQKCAFDVIANMTMGVDAEAKEKTGETYLKGVKVLGTCILERMFKPWFWSDLFWLTPTGRKMNKSLKDISNVVRKVINETSMKIQTNKNCFDSDTETIEGALIKTMLMHNETHETKFTLQNMEDEVNTFTSAGHETTALTMYWTAYLLGLYQDIQQKVFEELEEIFEDDLHRPITKTDLNRMHYLERVIKESQRLYPSIPFVMRQLSDDLKIDDVTIPKGVTVYLPIDVIHRDPKSFPDPEVFDPDRFLNSDIHPFAYIPFSAGTRNCIGQRFATLEVKTVLANVVRHFKLTSLDHRDKVLMSSVVVLKPSRPIKTKLEERIKLHDC